MKYYYHIKEIMKLLSTLAVFTSPFYPNIATLSEEAVCKAWPRLKSKEEITTVINEEKKKLDINESIDLRIFEHGELIKIGCCAYSAKSKTGGYIIGIDESYLKRITIRHELYHIFRDRQMFKEGGIDKEEDLKLLKIRIKELPLSFHYVTEPRTNLYSITGIRL